MIGKLSILPKIGKEMSFLDEDCLMPSDFKETFGITI